MLDDVERVTQPLDALRAFDLPQRVALARWAPDKLWEERDAALAAVQRLALGGPASGGLDAYTPEQIAAEVARIDALVMADRPVS